MPESGSEPAPTPGPEEAKPQPEPPPPPTVICDTSVLYYLHNLGRLDLLRQLYGRILVPEAVVGDLERGRAEGYDVPNVAEHDWVEVRTVQVPEVLRLVTDLGAGEAQALALALEDRQRRVVIDEKLGRQIAAVHKLPLTRTAGILLKAKQEGHVPAVAPLLDQLEGLGFRLSQDVRDLILHMAGEG